jgi:hypothetical protein
MTELTESGIKKDINKKYQDWIEYPIKKAEILRQEAKKAGEDVDTILLGHILSIILNDDASTFHIAKFGEYSLENIEFSRTGILGRLSLEIKFEETPEKLRKQLELARNELQEHDWKDKESFNKAYGIWKETVKNWTTNFCDTNPEIKEAHKEYLSFDDDLSRAYAKKV